MDYKEELRLALWHWQGEIYDLKVVKYLDESKSLKTQSFICLCWLTSRQSNWLILAADINQGCKNMCANPQSNWLNTIAVRASYILPILKRFPWWKPRKTGGWSISPRKKTKQKPFCVFSFRVDPLNRQSFIEIGEMACSTIAWCSRGHTLKVTKGCLILGYVVFLWNPFIQRWICVWSSSVNLKKHALLRR